ncbi:MAG: hypothetical protein FRX49_10529 [Trebouxia sp. A1-2]|nr:MAG: hypothetical protein FRX49_10529 [Trebouxia sp. A1-2]
MSVQSVTILAEGVHTLLGEPLGPSHRLWGGWGAGALVQAKGIGAGLLQAHQIMAAANEVEGSRSGAAAAACCKDLTGAGIKGRDRNRCRSMSIASVDKLIGKDGTSSALKAQNSTLNAQNSELRTQQRAVSKACDLIHGAIDAGSINALPGHQRVQELHMMSGGCKHQCRLAVFNGFSHQPQQSSDLVFSSAHMSKVKQHGLWEGGLA